ncbi:MAG: hypothetical protein V1746_00940 [bacterium]
MNRQALTLLETALTLPSVSSPPRPYAASVFLTDKWLNQAKRKGRK